MKAEDDVRKRLGLTLWFIADEKSELRVFAVGYAAGLQFALEADAPLSPGAAAGPAEVVRAPRKRAAAKVAPEQVHQPETAEIMPETAPPAAEPTPEILADPVEASDRAEAETLAAAGQGARAIAEWLGRPLAQVSEWVVAWREQQRAGRAAGG